MDTILLDTSVIFGHLNGRYGRTAYLEQLVDQGNSLACCPVNIAKQAGLLRRDWQRKGHTLSYTDVTIAAVALSNEVPLLTDNRKHFPMPELQLLPLPSHS